MKQNILTIIKTLTTALNISGIIKTFGKYKFTHFCSTAKTSLLSPLLWVYFWSSEAKDHKRVRGTPYLCTALGQTALRLAGGRGRREDERGTGAGGEGPGTRKARLPRQGKVWRAGWRGQSRDAPRSLLTSALWRFREEQAMGSTGTLGKGN